MDEQNLNIRMQNDSMRKRCEQNAWNGEKKNEYPVILWILCIHLSRLFIIQYKYKVQGAEEKCSKFYACNK